MKKRLFKILTLLLALCLTVTGSGCDKNNTLLFNNNFLGDGASGDAPAGYTETLNYTVEYKPEYERITTNPAFMESGVYYSFNGSYQMVFESGVSLPSEVQSNVKEEYSLYYRLTTTLELNAWYKINGTYAEGGTDKDGGREYLDKIISTVYFLPSGTSFAPIYAQTEQVYTCLVVGGGNYKIDKTEYTTKTTYQTDSYATTILVGEEKLDQTAKYDFKSLVDNTQLLFALRNLDIANKSTKEITVVSTAYPAPQTLSVTNSKEYTVNKTLTVNGEEKANLQFPVTSLHFNRKDGLNIGLWQYALVQKNTNEQTNPKALLLEYASPLTSYGNYLTMGALVYKLTSVNYN